ncbi:late blight resistance protein R1-A-like [Nicotiana tabacum]|uniref:Late blight resistance protein R1-A-like n=1 Tax=Nicotiana tabacum TaxID=4097 RepID=A0AC58SID4_TOBAC
MVNVITANTLARNIHVTIEFLLIILTDVAKGVIHQDKLFGLLVCVVAFTKEVSILFCMFEEISMHEENINETSCASLDLLENIKLLKEDLKHVFLKAPEDSSQRCFPISDGPLFMTLLLKNLNDLLNSNAYSVALIQQEIELVKEDIEFIRLFFGNVEQELNSDLWTRVLDVAYEAEHANNSILLRDHGLLHLIFLLPDTIEKIKLIKEEVSEKIFKNRGLIVANSSNKSAESKSSKKLRQITVGFEEETILIIRQLTSGPSELDVISIIGMPGSGKTTLAYKVYNDKSIISHFDIRAWCTVDQGYDMKKMLQKIYNQVTGSNKKFSEDFDVYDELRRKLYGRRYLIVLDDLWDTVAWDELTVPFQELQKGSRIILTSRKKEVALHGKRHKKRVFEKEECCPEELLDVGEKIARKCDGLPLVLDLIGGVIASKEKEKALWLEVLHNLKSFIFKDEEEVMKVIQLSYDNLSDHLKPCLLHLARYPKDENIKISKLKHLWSAEGLVVHTDMKSVEEVLEVYVGELISSSLVIDFNMIDDLMPRGLTIHYDHSDENLVLRNLEKKIPYVKHLLSLEAYGRDTHLSYNFHLRHLRLLKRLELHEIWLTYSLLNEIGMLVHLRCLIIHTKAEALPPSFSNLWNLETLMVYNFRSTMVLSPTIWSLAKLRHLRIMTCSVFDLYIDEPTVLEEDSKLENLRELYGLTLSHSEDTEDIFKRFPNLRSLEFSIFEEPLDCSVEQICFPRLDVLNELEKVSATFHCASSMEHTQQFDFHFPASLKKLELTRFNLTSDSLSRIARSLPNLQNLILQYVIIQGVGEEFFPVLEELKIYSCYELKEIPDSFGDIASLESISLIRNTQLKDSALKIKEYVAEMTGEDKLEVNCSSWERSLSCKLQLQQSTKLANSNIIFLLADAYFKCAITTASNHSDN